MVQDPNNTKITLLAEFCQRLLPMVQEAFVFDEWEWLKQLWDFGKSLTSDSLAPWVNRALPHLVSPTLRMVRTHAPRVRRVAAGQAKEILDLVWEIPRRLRNPWLWPLFLIATVGVGIEYTRWDWTVEPARAVVGSVYICAAVYQFVLGGIDRFSRRFR